jgi:NADH-quinone oxidoreductase subunit L
MGGMRKTMPRTYATFMIGTAALMGIPLITAGFWSKDEILAGASMLGGNGDGYTFALVMGLLGAVCTCAYMTRLIWYVFWGEPRGKSAEHQLHENGPRIVVPLMVLAFLAITSGWTNLPEKVFGISVPENLALRFEHFVEPTDTYFPSAANGFTHPEFVPWIAIASLFAIVVGAGSAYLWYWKGLGPHGLTERNRFARAGYRILETKYGLDILYTDWIAGSVKGPIARGANWVNQNVIDGMVNLVGTTARRSGEFVYRYIDQGVVDGVVNASGAGAEGAGEILRKTQTGQGVDRVINSRYIMGIDGISLPLIALTVFVVPLVIIYSWDHFPEPHNPKAFLILMLILETGMIGTFVAQDLLLFFVFFEWCCCRCTS